MRLRLPTAQPDGAPAAPPLRGLRDTSSRLSRDSVKAGETVDHQMRMEACRQVSLAARPKVRPGGDQRTNQPP